MRTSQRCHTLLLAFLFALAGAIFVPLAASAALLPCGDSRGCPDLQSDGNALGDWQIVNENFSPTDCAVVEGEVGGSGLRKLLKFTFATPNFGVGDLKIGDPNDNPELFDFNTCHGHAHFKEYADYRLWTPAGYDQWQALRAANPNALAADLLAANPSVAAQMTAGGKRGFCMIDIWDYGSSQPRKYTSCTFQGVSVLWGDVYHQDLDGQWIDITDTPDGSYILEVEVNAERILEESNYTNNSAAIAVAIASAPGPEGLVAAYGFDEGQGFQTADASGQQNNGTVQGATWTPDGKFGKALVFNGTSSLVSISDAPSLDLSSGMTLSAWIYPTGGLTGWRNIIKKEGDVYFLNSNTPDGGPGGGIAPGVCCQFVRAGPTLPLNTWTHVAVTYNGSALRLYRNGALVATTSTTGSIVPSSLPLRIGGDTTYGEYVQGRIDEVRIYNRALSAIEIPDIMNTAVNPASGQPALSIPDSSIPPSEGDTGTAPMHFQVSLSPASSQTVTVQYATAPNTATAGVDYQSTSGTLTFAPGVTAQDVHVDVVGDTLSEASETFFVDLSAPTNATISRARATGTIVDDDPLPTLSIGDVTVTEGDSGTAAAAFAVTLSPASGQTVTVQYATANGSASSGSDYSAASGTLTFSAGETSKTVNVNVVGDTVSESTETFNVNLTAPTGATISDAQGVGTINDNDAPAAPKITVVSPNGGGVWKIGQTRAIQWTSTSVSGNVTIEVSRDGGSTWQVLFASVANSGSQNWTVSGPATTQALIRVTSVNAPSITDQSDRRFAIK